MWLLIVGVVAAVPAERGHHIGTPLAASLPVGQERECVPGTQHDGCGTTPAVSVRHAG